MEKFYYLLPKANFFKRGYRGSVIHALGIINGFEKKKIDLKVLHRGGLEKFIKKPNHVLKGIKGLKYLKSLLAEKNNRLIIRYSISNVLLLGLLQCIAKNKNSICLEVNTVSSMYGKNGFKEKVINFIEKIILRRFNVIYVVSHNAKSFLNKEFKIPLKNMVVIPNALIDNQIKSSIEINKQSNTKNYDSRLVYFGSLHAYYDIEQICAWLRQFNMDSKNDIQLHIYGNDDSNKTKSLEKNYPNTLIFHGKYKNNKIDKFIKSSDILILPYKSNTIAEFGSPTKLFEYMSLHSPILASSVGQLADVLINKQTGIIYNNQNEFNEGLKLLIEDISLRERIASNAYNEVLKTHTWEMRINDLINFWEKKR